MEVIITQAGAEKILPSGARQQYPVGWRGVVEDQVGAVWVDEGIAEDITPELGDQGFTSRQVAVLRAMADEVLAAHDSADVSIDFSDMKVDQLRDLADIVGIEGASKLKKADLVKALEDHQDQLHAAIMEAATDDEADD